MKNIFLFMVLTITIAVSAQDEAQACLAVIGDSLPYGEATFIVPGQGFITARTLPLSRMLQQSIAQTPGLDYEVRDHSSPATSLNWYSDLPYLKTDEYAALLQNPCQMNVIIPWYNDYSLIERGDGPAEYTAWLGYLIFSLKAQRPDSQFLIVNFFPVYPADFMNTVYQYINPESIAMFNAGLAVACEPDGALARIEGVKCADTQGLFDVLAGQHVLRDVSIAGLDALLYEPLTTQERDMLQFAPNGVITGDGVHLTEAGKRLLVDFILREIAAF